MTDKSGTLPKVQIQSVIDRIERIERELGILRSELAATQQRVVSHTTDLDSQRELLTRLLTIVSALRDQMMNVNPILEQLESTLKSVHTKT